MSYNIQGKTVLVTGANRGLGKALVQTLITRGAKSIYAAGRDAESLTNIVNLAPAVIKAIQLDVTRTEDIQLLAAQLPQLDVLINNAGIATGITFSAENSLSVASAEMATNYFGPLHLTHALLPLLRASKGAVVNISSIAGIANFPSLGPYSASKAAVHSFTQGLRAELRSAGVFVQGVYPGPIDTDMTKGSEMNKADAADVAKNIINGLEAGEEDIFPDMFSQTMYEIFNQNPKHLEQQFGQMLG